MGVLKVRDLHLDVRQVVPLDRQEIDQEFVVLRPDSAVDFASKLSKCLHHNGRTHIGIKIEVVGEMGKQTATPQKFKLPIIYIRIMFPLTSQPGLLAGLKGFQKSDCV